MTEDHVLYLNTSYNHTGVIFFGEHCEVQVKEDVSFDFSSCIPLLQGQMIQF